MLLRDDRQAALNRVETLCLAGADHYESAAGQARDTALANVFREMAQRRRAQAEGLAPHIRAIGDLPKQPDPDREALDHVLDGIRMLLSRDEGAELIEQRLREENDLLEAVRDAMKLDFPAPTQEALLRMGEEIESERARLLQSH